MHPIYNELSVGRILSLKIEMQLFDGLSLVIDTYRIKVKSINKSLPHPQYNRRYTRNRTHHQRHLSYCIFIYSIHHFHCDQVANV